jgi:glycosyltransferase involved in cell wall biosynthesis
MKISVITACLNARAALEYTLASVAAQSDAEHIVIDGGSKDGTVALLERRGVRFLSEPDSGIAEALNKGLSLATGEYILVLGAGDVLADFDSLARARPHLNSDMVSFDVMLMGKGRLKARPFGLRTWFKMTSPHQGLLVRRSLYERIGGFDTQYRIAMDYEFLLRAMTSGASLKVVSEVLSLMPDDGVSTLSDWPSVKKRLSEDRRLQQAHGRPNRLFWSVYMPFKRLRASH